MRVAKTIEGGSCFEKWWGSTATNKNGERGKAEGWREVEGIKEGITEGIRKETKQGKLWAKKEHHHSINSIDYI
ncbi:MAG: hypothetical protein ACUVWQ_08880 [Candidatus Aminicenantales bacterium]